MIGQIVAHYTITRKLGAGGMGEVYLAEDTTLDRQVALKLLPPNFATDEAFKARFKQEAKAAAALRHPGIITVYELGEHDGRIYIAMEYVPGQTLEELITSGRISVDRFTKLAEQIADALATAHEAGIIHRDIKPSNILVDENDRIKVLDFGLARRSGATRLTQTGSTLGTLLYQSPEQARGENVDLRSDIFSVGAVFYEMLSGRAAFQGDYDAAIVYSIAHEDPAPLSDVRDDVPSETEEIIRRALAKDPSERYQSLSELLGDLRAGVAPVSTPSRPVAASSGKSRKLPLTIAVSALAAVALLVFVLKPWSLFSGGGEAEVAENALAIMYFDNLSDPTDGDRLGEMCSDLLITGLSDNPDIQIVSSQRIYHILKKLGKEGQRQVDLETANAIAREARARWLLVGKIIQINPLMVTAQILNTYTGELRASQRNAATEGESIFEQFDRLAADVRVDLGLAVDSGASLAAMITESPEAYRHYLEGIQLCRDGFPQEGKSAFDRALEFDSTMALAYYWKIRQGLERANSDTLIARAVRYSPGLSERDSTIIYAWSERLKGNFAVYGEILEDLHRKDSSDLEVLDELGRAYLYLLPMALPQAISTFKKHLALAPDNRELYNSLAVAYKQRRTFDTALIWSSEQVERFPAAPKAHDTHAEILASNGRYKEAIESYHKSLDLAPHFDNTLFLIGRLYAHIGDKKRSDSCILLQLRAGGAERRSEARINLPYAYRYSGNFSKVIEIFDDGIHNDSLEGEPTKYWSYPWKFIAKAWALAELSRYDEALRVLDHARHAAENVTSIELVAAMQYQIMYHADLGHLEIARTLLDTARTIVGNRRSGLMRAFFNTAANWLLYKEGNADSAIHYFNLPQNRAILPTMEHLLAQIYIDVGRAEEAIPLLKNWTDRIETLGWQEPELFVKAHYYLGRAYEKTQDKNNARAQYQLFIDRWGGSPDRIPLIDDARKRHAQL